MDKLTKKQWGVKLKKAAVKSLKMTGEISNKMKEFFTGICR